MSATTATTEDNGTYPVYIGYIATAITCLAFGSYFVPVKKFDAGDGVFFQWVQCSAIITYGVLFNLIIGNPYFEPLAMVGGVMWCTGNMLCVTVVQLIGLGIGMNLWSSVGMVLGWAAGRFGFFGAPAIPSIEWLQYLGIALSIVRAALAALIQPSVNNTSDEQSAPAANNPGTINLNEITLTKIMRKVSRAMSKVIENGDESHVPYREMSGPEAAQGRENNATTSNEAVNEIDAIEANLGSTAATSAESNSTFLSRMSPFQRQMFGISLAVFAGCNFGFQFATVDVAKSNGGSSSDKDYSFSFYCGTFTASTFYMIVYALLKHNKPIVNPSLIAPGYLSGLLWVVGQTGWFFANESLNQAITFPLMSAGPALVSLTWGFFVFNELQGLYNRILLLIIVIVTIASVLMVALSM